MGVVVLMAKQPPLQMKIFVTEEEMRTDKVKSFTHVTFSRVRQLCSSLEVIKQQAANSQAPLVLRPFKG